MRRHRYGGTLRAAPHRRHSQLREVWIATLSVILDREASRCNKRTQVPRPTAGMLCPELSLKERPRDMLRSWSLECMLRLSNERKRRRTVCEMKPKGRGTYTPPQPPGRSWRIAAMSPIMFQPRYSNPSRLRNGILVIPGTDLEFPLIA